MLPPLDDAVFEAWRHEIQEADITDFYYGHKGNDRLLRFVCQLDRFNIQPNRRGNAAGATVAEAYASANGISIDESQKRAYGIETGYKHPAVQGMLNRLRYRERSLTWITVESKWRAVIEKLLDDVLTPEDGKEPSAKMVELALKGVASYAGIVSMDDVRERQEASKRSIEAARHAALEAEHGKNVTPTKERARTMLIAMRNAIGSDDFRDILVDVLPQKALTGPPV